MFGLLLFVYGAEADSIAPSELRRIVCPLESLDLFGEAPGHLFGQPALMIFLHLEPTVLSLKLLSKAFSIDYTNLEFEKLCSSCGRNQDCIIRVC